MSTRAYLMLKNGTEVRYCFTHWDGYGHGDELKGMDKATIEKIWETLGDTTKAYGFETFHCEASRQEMVEHYQAEAKKNPDSSVYKDSLKRYQNYKPVPELYGNKPDASTSGVFQLPDTKVPLKAEYLAPMNGDAWVFIEFVWLYDMQTGKTYYYTCWHPEHLSKKKFAQEYKRHLFRGENFCND